MAQKKKRILFVDDEVGLLDFIRQLMGHFAGPAWEIFTAPDVSKALGILQEQRIDLLVLDIHLPVVDGLQFLNLLQRKFPNVLKVVLTGDATEHHRATCLSNGAELFLEKPRDEGGWHSVYATLHELTRFQPEEGFRGVLRRVGLQDVLQMECLARNSSVLRIHAGSVHGTVFVKDGQIIHAQCGSRIGEDAFNYLLGLSGGEFDVQPFTAPTNQSISGSWEFLLMEAARKRDEEGVIHPPPGNSDSGFTTSVALPAGERHTPVVVPVIEAITPVVEIPSDGQVNALCVAPARPQVDELLVCSLQGEVLHEWQCTNANGRVGFLEFLSQKARQLAQGLPLGEFDRLEANGEITRVVAQIQPDRALFVRTSRVLAGKRGRNSTPMKELINQWFEQSDPFEGILACGVRYPDQTTAAKTWCDGFTEAGVEHALRCVVDCFQVLQLNRIPLARIRWIYQGGLLLCERRQDGTCLGVFLTRDTASVDLDGMARFFAEFQALATAAAL